MCFVNAARNRIGAPYIWGDEGKNGYDCSGLVRDCFRDCGIELPDMTANKMLNEYFHECKILPAAAHPGDLFFYGEKPETVSHVMIVLNVWDNGNVVVCGARGGDSRTVNENIAMQQGAFVDAAVNYWPKGLQFAVNPFRKWEKSA